MAYITVAMVIVTRVRHNFLVTLISQMQKPTDLNHLRLAVQLYVYCVEVFYIYA